MFALVPRRVPGQVLGCPGGIDAYVQQGLCFCKSAALWFSIFSYFFFFLFWVVR